MNLKLVSRDNSCGQTTTRLGGISRYRRGIAPTTLHPI